MKRFALAAATLLIVLAAYAHWPRTSLDRSARADRVVVSKSDRTLALYRSDKLLKLYRVSLGGSPEGRKEREGDGRTPEGQYTLDYRNPNSAFHRSLHISYPSAADRARAKAQGVSPGGAVMIHGLRNNLGWLGRLHLALDWTNGCVAVTNQEMDEIWRAVPDGTLIELRP